MKKNSMPLTSIPVGTRAKVTGLISRGTERRRMLDLGVIGGTVIMPLYGSPFGNPTAYLIRGAVIALRSDVAGKILVEA